VENIQRENLNPIDEAKAFVRLLADGKTTQKDLAKMVGKSQPYISNAMRVLETAPEVQDRLASGKITVGAAKAIAALPETEQVALVERIEKENLNAREVEAAAADSRRMASSREREEKAKAERAEKLASVVTDAVRDGLIPKKGQVALAGYNVKLDDLAVPKGIELVQFDWNKHQPHVAGGFTCECKVKRLSIDWQGNASVEDICVEPDHHKAYVAAQEAERREAAKAQAKKLKDLRDDIAPLLAASDNDLSDHGWRLLAYGLILADRQRALALCRKAEVKHPKIATYENANGVLVWDATLKVERSYLVLEVVDMLTERFIPDVYRNAQWDLEKGIHVRRWMMETLQAPADILWGGRDDVMDPKPPDNGETRDGEDGQPDVAATVAEPPVPDAPDAPADEAPADEAPATDTPDDPNAGQPETVEVSM
jgi:ParB-like chromosome segregation protein Spo0J